MALLDILVFAQNTLSNSLKRQTDAKTKTPEIQILSGDRLNANGADMRSSNRDHS